MRSWVRLAVAVAVPAAAILLVLLAALCLHCRRRRRPPVSNVDENGIPPKAKSTRETLQSGISRLRRSYGSDAAALRFQHLERSRLREAHRYCELHRLGSDFSWGDHPALVTDAAEGGWSRFAFLGRSESVPRSLSLLGSCVACDHGHPAEAAAEVGWEVPVGSSDVMQTVRLNPASSIATYGGARMRLPLPGPPLGGDPPSFPQEAYFEITVLHLHPPPPPVQHRLPLRWSKRVKDSYGEGDRRKLISDTYAAAAVLSDDPTQGSAAAAGGEAQEPKKPDGEEQSEEEEPILCLGLTGGGASPEKPPGSYRGSIGFYSNGSVHLDGMKLVFESEKARWSAANRVVGCGFDPGKKSVFFTMDSVLLHVVHCNSNVFRSPLYPALASNADVMVLVNLGQCPFKYSPANAHRTPDPCFLRPGPADPSAHIGYDDSRELFSMGRIDSQWMASARRAHFNGGRNGGGDGGGGGGGGEESRDFDVESDLFEISLNK